MDSERDDSGDLGLLLAIYDRCECSVSLDYELDSIYCRLGSSNLESWGGSLAHGLAVSFEVRPAGERTAGGAHGLHLGPLQGVLDPHVVPHGVRMRKPATALDHRTHGTVARVVAVQVLSEDPLLQRGFAQRTGQHVVAAPGSGYGCCHDSCPGAISTPSGPSSSAGWVSRPCHRSGAAAIARTGRCCCGVGRRRCNCVLKELRKVPGAAQGYGPGHEQVGGQLLLVRHRHRLLQLVQVLLLVLLVLLLLLLLVLVLLLLHQERLVERGLAVLARSFHRQGYGRGGRRGAVVFVVVVVAAVLLMLLLLVVVAGVHVLVVVAVVPGASRRRWRGVGGPVLLAVVIVIIVIVVQVVMMMVVVVVVAMMRLVVVVRLMVAAPLVEHLPLLLLLLLHQLGQLAGRRTTIRSVCLVGLLCLLLLDRILPRFRLDHLLLDAVLGIQECACDPIRFMFYFNFFFVERRSQSQYRKSEAI